MEIFEAFKKNTEQIVSATKVELDKKISKLYAPDGTIVISEHKKDDEVVPGEYDISLYNDDIVVYVKNEKEFDDAITYIKSKNETGTIYLTDNLSLHKLAQIQSNNFTLEDWSDPNMPNEDDFKFKDETEREKWRDLYRKSIINFGTSLDKITIAGYGEVSVSSINRISCSKPKVKIQLETGDKEFSVIYTIKAYSVRFKQCMFGTGDEYGKMSPDNPKYPTYIQEHCNWSYLISDRTVKPILMLQHTSTISNCIIYLLHNNIGNLRDKIFIEMFGNHDEYAVTKGSLPRITIDNCQFYGTGYGAEDRISQSKIVVQLSNYTSGGGAKPNRYEDFFTVNNSNIITTHDNDKQTFHVIDNRKKNKDKTDSEIDIPCKVTVNAIHFLCTYEKLASRESSSNLECSFCSLGAFNKAYFYGLSEGSPYRLIGINSAGKVMQYDYSQSVLSGESVANRRDEITDAADNSTYPTTKAVKDYVDAAISGGAEYATIDDIDAMFEEPLL